LKGVRIGELLFISETLFSSVLQLMTFHARTKKDLERGDLSPLLRFADSSAKQSGVQQARRMGTPTPVGGDKSPAESGENSPHSICCGCCASEDVFR